MPAERFPLAETRDTGGRMHVALRARLTTTQRTENDMKPRAPNPGRA